MAVAISDGIHSLRAASTRRRSRRPWPVAPSSSLARYRVPREVVFVDQVPRNTTRNILERELR
jgi:acyl-CoA synthetase (AMP-forming)/AMP-acid ligase II